MRVMFVEYEEKKKFFLLDFVFILGSTWKWWEKRILKTSIMRYLWTFSGNSIESKFCHFEIDLSAKPKSIPGLFGNTTESCSETIAQNFASFLFVIKVSEYILNLFIAWQNLYINICHYCIRKTNMSLGWFPCFTSCQ
jgi:hypothetical protein